MYIYSNIWFKMLSVPLFEMPILFRDCCGFPLHLVKTRLSSIESQPKKVVVVVFIDGLVFVVVVVLSVVVII